MAERLSAVDLMAAVACCERVWSWMVRLRGPCTERMACHASLLSITHMTAGLSDVKNIIFKKKRS